MSVAAALSNPASILPRRGWQRSLWVGALALLGVTLILRRQIAGLDLLEVGDESETIVTAKMLAAGMRLYAEVFNHHGPLTFLPGVLIAWLGDPAIPVYRIPILLGQWGGIAALYWSPLLRGIAWRPWLALGLGALLVHYVPVVLGNVFLYQTMAAQMLAVAFAVLILPAVVESGRRPQRWQLALGNLLLAGLPFLGFIYIPLAGLLFLAALRADTAKESFAWLFTGVALNLAWLIAIGSIPGFVAYHFYMNIVLLPTFVQTSPQSIAEAIEACLASGPYAWVAGPAFAALAVGLVWRDDSWWRWRSVFVVLAIVSILIRGPLFHALPFYYLLFAIPLIYVSPRSPSSRQLAAVAFVFFALAIVDTLRPPLKHALGALAMTPIPAGDDNSGIIRDVTLPDDRILAYTFANSTYLFADRLPASGYFFYFPWQAAYSRDPVLGINIDACRDIRLERPKAVLLDRQPAFNLPLPQFLWRSYGSCIDDAVAHDYVKLLSRPLYLRSDVFEASGLTAQADEGRYSLVPSAPLNPKQPLRIALDPRHPLRRVGILLGTYQRSYPGSLRLQWPAGTQTAVSSSVEGAQDNQYAWFDAAGVGAGEAILSSSAAGAAVSVWMSHDARDGDSRPCIAYEYANGLRGYTPGCR